MESDRDTAFQRFWQAGIMPTTCNIIAFEGLRRIELHDGIQAGARSQGVSDTGSRRCLMCSRTCW